MKLHTNDIPDNIRNELYSFNITQIEQFVSMTKSQKLLIKLSALLKISKEDLIELADKLQRKYPELNIPEPHTKHFPTGYSIL